MKACFIIMARWAVAAFVAGLCCTLTVLAGERSPAAAGAATPQDPPSDLNQFPEPIKKYAQMIADLCKTDLKKQEVQLQTAIDGLRTNLPRYFEKATHARTMYDNLFYDRHIGAYWDWLGTTEERGDFAKAFVVTRILLFPKNWPDEMAGPEYFKHTWEHQLYNGLYCYSHSQRQPPETALAKKPDAS